MPEPWAPTEIFVGWGGGVIGQAQQRPPRKTKKAPHKKKK